MFARPKPVMVSESAALPGRPTPIHISDNHLVLGTSVTGPWPAGHRVLYLALGCFWGAEKAMWEHPGIWTTAVGYMGGFTPNPTYTEVCTGMTGHTETVLVVYDPDIVSDEALVTFFFELHDPTQGFRQGNDVGTQYRSAIYFTTDEQGEAARRIAEQYGPRLADAGFGPITTEIAAAHQVSPFYYAEDYHQQYLVKNPNGYCPVHSTGVKCG